MTSIAHFSQIARRYDRNNAILSFGMHAFWNRKLRQAIIPHIQNGTYLDICAGTGAISIPLASQANKAILLDLCPEMLAIAKDRAPHLEILCADAQEIPLPDNSINAISCAYGIRNVPDPLKCAHEVHRILKPGCRFAILELTRPNNFLARFYLHRCIPLLGPAYKYLSESIQKFTDPHTLASQFESTGLRTLSIRPFAFNAATLSIFERS